MKHKNTLNKRLCFLAVALLAVTAFIRGPKQIWAYIGAFTIFGIWTLAAWCTSPQKHERTIRRRGMWQNNKSAREHSDRYLRALLMRHVNYRISDCLLLAYPDSSWEWYSASPDETIVDGGVGRIRLFGVPNFDFAEVEVDRWAHISCELVQKVSLSATQGNEKRLRSAAQLHEQHAKSVLWFDSKGRGLLEELAADLQSRGHSSLTIKDSGDICIKQSGVEIVEDSISDMPGKESWPMIVKALEKTGLAATASDGGITVSW